MYVICIAVFPSLYLLVKEKYGSDLESDFSTDSESETEDEDGDELTPAVDAAILRTLARIRKRDPGIYEVGRGVFDGACSYRRCHVLSRNNDVLRIELTVTSLRSEAMMVLVVTQNRYCFCRCYKAACVLRTPFQSPNLNTSGLQRSELELWNFKKSSFAPLLKRLLKPIQ